MAIAIIVTANNLSLIPDSVAIGLFFILFIITFSGGFTEIFGGLKNGFLVGLKEEEVEDIEANHKNEAFTDEEINSFIKEGQIISAIKAYRILYKVGLKDAKNAVEERIDKLHR